jgi:kynurenine formamidase
MKPEYEKLVREQSIVLLYTGHDRLFGKPEYFDNYPVVDSDLCQLFIRKKIKMLGMDGPSPDREPYQVHKSLLTMRIYIIENLTNLGNLAEEKSFEVIALPLKIRANSSPARVVARIGRGYNPTQMRRLAENLMDLPPLTLTDMQPHFRRPRNP